METEQTSQHQHAQWLASLATGHFVQQSISSVAQSDASQQGNSQPAEDDSHIVDMSGHTVVKLAPEASEEPPAVAPTSGSPFNLRRNLKKRRVDQDEPERHEFKLIRPKERVSAKSYDMRRPVRPIDRQKMRPWLKNLLDTGSVFGLTWLQREEGVFQISWRHASRLGWNLETDGDVFERWARHTGIFKDGDDPEPKRWKANFRCALHSLPDVKELTSPTDRKGRNASRTYRFLRPNEVQPPVKRKQRYNIQIPYTVYENQASEDSSSQQADSDDRNTDEEAMVPEQVQAFPHCDHDYAMRIGKSHGEQPASEILSKHNSGYVLIKSKDAHEFEFRLTPPQTTVQSSGTKRSAPASKASSPQRKGKGSRKKPTPASSPAKKGKGKAGQKMATFKKDGKQMKKAKKLVDRSSEASPATKVSLKALLSGRKNTVGGKRSKGGQSAGPASKKVKRAKNAAAPVAKGKDKTEREGSGTSTPVQTQGLDVLWKAANQIEGMDPLTSAPPTTPTNTPSRAAPKRASRTKVATTQPSVKSPTIRSKPSPTSHVLVPNVATPIVLTAHPMIATRTTGAAFTPIPVLASVQAAGAPNPVPSHVSLSMLHKILGLSPMQAIPASSMPMTLVPGQVLTAPIVSAKAEVKKSPQIPANQKAAQMSVDLSAQNKKKGKAAVGTSKAESSSSASHAGSTLVPQPEGTSMLKHLLRLTGPSMSLSTVPITTTITTSTASHIIPPAPQVPSPLPTVSTTVKESGTAGECVVKLESQVSPTSVETGAAEESAVDQTNQSGQNSQAGFAQWETESSQEQSVSNADSENVVRGQLSSAQDCEKPEPMDTEGTPRSCSAVLTKLSSMSAPLPAVNRLVTLGTDLAQSSEGVQRGVPSPQILAPAGVCVAQASVPAQPLPNAVPQVTLCLPQAILGPQSQQVPVGGTQTMTLALPQASVSALQGQGGTTATFTHSIDLLQFLNLCAASGNGQVIIKAEPSVPTDMPAGDYALTSEHRVMSQGGGEASVVPSFILVDANQETSAHTVLSSTQSQSSGGQAVMSGVSAASVIQSAVMSASSAGANAPSQLTTMDSAAFSGTVDSFSSSAAVQSPALSTSVDCLAESAAETHLDLATTLRVGCGSVQEAVLMQASQEVGQGEISLTGGEDMVTNQLVHEADITALSADQQGADSFIVEDMLL